MQSDKTCGASRSRRDFHAPLWRPSRAFVICLPAASAVRKENGWCLEVDPGEGEYLVFYRLDVK